jgi:hypothetical protein
LKLKHPLRVAYWISTKYKEKNIFYILLLFLNEAQVGKLVLSIGGLG